MKTDVLDVIIIGKNEEKVLSQTFLSVKMASEKIEKSKKILPNVLYVDSQSTDRSVKIAKEFGVKVIELKGKCSPAIARNEGSENTSSKYIFFLDGDTLVGEEWLVESVNYLEKNLKISGVGGKLIFNMLNSEGKLLWTDINYRGVKKEIEDIYDGVGGTFLYRRASFIKAGGFSNKYKIGEEFDLMLRVLSTGGKIKRINKHMAVHNDYKTENISFIKRYLLTNNIFIPGKIVANAPKNFEVLNVILKRYWLQIIQFPLLLILLFSILLFNLGSSLIILVLLIILNLIYKNMNLKRGLVSLITMNFYSVGFYIGLINNK